jgi:hypothetical protein
MSLVKVKDGSGNISRIPKGAFDVLNSIAGYTLVQEEQECTKPVIVEAKIDEPQIEIENEEVKVDGEIQQHKKTERKSNRKPTNKVELQQPERGV